MYKKKSGNEATCVRPHVPIAHRCCILLPHSSSRWSYSLTVQTKRGNYPPYFPLNQICYRRHTLHAGSRVFSGPAQPSLISGRLYALRGLGMPVRNHQSRFCRQACWMCLAGDPQDKAQAMAGGDMLYLLPSFIGCGGYSWQYVRIMLLLLL